MNILLLTVVILISFSTAIFAEDTEIKKFAEVFLKNLDAALVEYKDLGNLYEITYESKGKKGVLYTTKDKQYIIVGSVITKDGENLTKERLQSLNKVRFSDIPIDSAIAIHKGNGKKKIVMFTDVDCPYCRKAFSWLESKTNYSLYVFLSPIEKLHPKAREKSIQVLCSDNKASALSSAKRGIRLENSSCEKGEKLLAKHVLAGQIIGVKGTPIFVFEDGRVVEGFDQNQLSNYLPGSDRT